MALFGEADTTRAIGKCTQVEAGIDKGVEECTIKKSGVKLRRLGNNLDLLKSLDWKEYGSK